MSSPDGDYGHLTLPPGSNLLHIGPQKTGSTALQMALHEARAALREHGVVYPAGGVQPARVMAGGLGIGRRRGKQPPSQRAWTRFCDEIADAKDERVCVSNEFLARAGSGMARKVIDAVGGDRPHVFAVARRYDALLPSQWQQRVKARQLRGYEDWLRVVLGTDSEDPAWRNVWIPHDTVGVLERWGELVGAENVTLLVADETDRTLLPRVTEGMLGLPAGILQPPRDRSNRSFSYHEAEVLRMVMAELERLGVDAPTWLRVGRQGVTQVLMRQPYPDGDPRVPQLPAWARERVIEISDERIRQLQGVGARVVGDLEHLRVAPAEDAPESVAEPELLSREAVRRVIAALAAAAVETDTRSSKGE